MGAYEPMSAVMSKAVSLAEKNLSFQQFGQVDDESAWDGAAACTHVVCQFLALLWTGRRLTIDQVSAKAGYPYRPRNSAGQPRGMNNTELARFFSNMGLPYVIRFGQTFDTMASFLKYGPVFLGVRHGSIPEWKDFVYFGTRADGSPNGYARRYGRTQLTGFENGRHAVLLLGRRQYVSDSASATVTCDTIVRRGATISSQKLGAISKGATVHITATVDGSHWSGCGKDGTRWHRITSINGKSTRARYGRAYAYIASGLTTSPGPVVLRTDVWRKDPNHNSGSRPENPPYDVIRNGQSEVEYLHYRTKLGSTLYGAIPTRRLGVVGLSEAEDIAAELGLDDEPLTIPENLGEPPDEDGADDAVPSDEAVGSELHG
ncbi:MAG TPA: SH3 domain-containing protein [Actinomycetes bacterium]|nr:SH3 domain-containing protein [Actinomycetes bacterium]